MDVGVYGCRILRSPPEGEARAALSKRVGGLLLKGKRSPTSLHPTSPFMQDMNLQLLTSLLWVSVKLQLALSPRQVEASVVAARKLLPACPDAKLIVVCCWSLRRLGASPSKSWLDEIEALTDIRQVWRPRGVRDDSVWNDEAL